jgi:Helix-turn-helix domain/Putative transposase
MLQSLPPLTGDRAGESLAKVAGFSLHASVATEAHQKNKLDRVASYITRPPVAIERLSLTPQGHIPARGSRYWEVKIPQLGVFTQGRSERNAYAMAANALETLVGEKRFRVQVVPLDGGRFLIRANDSRPLIARWLFRLRADKGLSLREAAARMGSSSSEAWARYESGRASPTVEKLSELIHALDPEADFVVRRVTAPALKEAG